jgi:Golgi SNAP receptor complex protein 2
VNGDNTTALQGQIAASLAALNRTVDDYDSMAKKEMIKAKQEKAFMRVQKFRADYNDLRAQFERAKVDANNARASSVRNELYTNPMTGEVMPNTARQRFAPNTMPPPSPHRESPFAAAPPPSSMLRQQHVLREHSFIQDTEDALDGFIAQGRSVLDNLVDQKDILKGTHKRLLDAANTLGLSRNVIAWIEKRSQQDMIIFIIGAIFTLFCFWLIWHYLA